jgi:hypothetical protein
MKKLILSFLAFGIISTGISQAVSDRTTVPLAVNLNQVLRLNVLNGGNIEFTFNTIAQYKNGINSSAAPALQNAATALPGAGAGGFYMTQFTVASSNNWEIHMGAEDATLIGTDDPANTMPLNNVGYSLTSDGNHTIFNSLGGVAAAANEVLISTPTTDGSAITALTQFPGAAALIDMNPAPPANEGNAGDIADNTFSIFWRVGTSETDMNPVALIEQNRPNDRYVTNILFDLQLAQ